MFSTWARGRRWLGYAGLTLLAVAGQLVFNEAVATIIRSQGKPWTILTPQYDFSPIWTPTYLFLSGQAVPHWYGIGISNAWPPPHEVLLAPFGLLPYQAAHVASMLATAALMVTAAALKREESRGGHYRSDFPKTDPKQARRTFLTLADARRIAATAETVRVGELAPA